MLSFGHQNMSFQQFNIKLYPKLNLVYYKMFSIKRKIRAKTKKPFNWLYRIILKASVLVEAQVSCHLSHVHLRYNFILHATPYYELGESLPSTINIVIIFKTTLSLKNSQINTKIIGYDAREPRIIQLYLKSITSIYSGGPQFFGAQL